MRQRGSSWELLVYVGRDAVTQKKRYATKTVRGGKREAQRALAAMVAEAGHGRLASSTATVGDLLERWFEHAEADYSPKTALETRGLLDRNLLPALGHVKLSKLRAADLDRYYARLRKEGSRTGKPLAPATIRRLHGVIRRALGQGVRWGWLGSNPAADASPPRVAVSAIRPPAPDGVARLFALAGELDPDLATFVVLAAATGARRSELVALRWADIDLDAGRLEISRALVMGRSGLVEKDTKTHSARNVSLDPTTVDVLRAHHARAADRGGAARRWCRRRGRSPRRSTGSTPWRPDSTTRAFNRLTGRPLSSSRPPACTWRRRRGRTVAPPTTAWRGRPRSSPQPVG